MSDSTNRLSRPSAVSHVAPADNETASIYLQARAEAPPVSRDYVHLLRQM